eukprot:3066501-Pyramimonas_sp.AAC.1
MAVLAAELIIGSARLMRFLLLRSSNYAGVFINACASFLTCSITSQCLFMSNLLPNVIFYRLCTTMGLGPAGSRITDGVPTR